MINGLYFNCLLFSCYQFAWSDHYKSRFCDEIFDILLSIIDVYRNRRKIYTDIFYWATQYFSSLILLFLLLVQTFY